MGDEIDFNELDTWGNYDVYQSESERFARDVNFLLFWSFHKGVQALNDDAKREYDQIDEYLKTARGDDEFSLIDDQIKIQADLADQERFLRNIGLVALLSRLTHALHRMAYHAESWAPPNPKGYGNRHDDEFKKLWCSIARDSI